VVLLDTLSVAKQELAVTRPIIRFSQPGFSTSRDTAIVFVNRYCGGLCGEFNLILLVREQGKWKGVRRIWSALSMSREDRQNSKSEVELAVALFQTDVQRRHQ
jgi:hypothetical protein